MRFIKGREIGDWRKRTYPTHFEMKGFMTKLLKKQQE